MPKFPLEKVLDYRRHLRLEKRNALSAAMAHERELLDHKQHLETQRGEQLQELTELAHASELDVAAAARRRHFVGRLDVELLILGQHIEDARRRVEVARSELMKTDQDVKALEKLKEKHVTEQTYVATRSTERELSEQWQAANWSW